MVAVTTMAAVLPVVLTTRLAVTPMVIGGAFGRLVVVSVDRLGCVGVGGMHRYS